MRNPVVAIVGRPNVGKSTLFNRLVGRKLAVVHGDPGVTRDRNVAVCRWGRNTFVLVDTGGYVPSAQEGIEALVREQAALAIEHAAVVILVVDGEAGLVSLDQEIARLLRRKEKPTIIAVNKTDNPGREAHAQEFHRLALDEPLPVSALHGIGIGELLDRVLELLGEVGPVDEPADAVKIAVIGKPNVGKSSLVNTLLREQRMLVDEMPGTTRDSIDSFVTFRGQKLALIDTAGLRRKRSLSSAVELSCVVRAIRSVERADLVFIVFDASLPLSAQDIRIAALAHKSGKPSIIVINKWDLVSKDSKTALTFERSIRERLPFLAYAPVMFVSALTGQRVPRLLSMALGIVRESQKEITEEAVTSVLKEAFQRRHPPVTQTGRTPTMRRAYQSSLSPPTFTLIVSDARAFRKAYILYLVRSLREAFGFSGTPLRLRLRTVAGRRD